MVFNPDVQTQDPQSFLRYSQGPGVNRGFEELFKGIGEVGAGVVNVVDTNNKTDIYNQLSASVDQTRNLFGVDAKSDTAASPVDTPVGLTGSADYLSRLQKGYINGSIKQSDYYGKLQATVKAMRAQYPGYQEYIDSAIQNITGVTPANAIVSALHSEAEQQASLQREQANKEESFTNANLGTLDIMTGGHFSQNPNDYSYEDKRALVGRFDAVKTNIQMQNSELELEAKQGTITKDKVAQSANAVSSMMSAQIASGGLGPLGKSYQEISNKFQQYAAHPEQLSPDDSIAIQNSIAQLRIQATNAINQALSQGQYGTYLDKDTKQKIIDDAIRPITMMQQAISTKDFSLANSTAAWITQSLDQSKAGLLAAHPIMGKLNAVNALGGQVGAGIVFFPNSDNQRALSKIVLDDAAINAQTNQGQGANADLAQITKDMNTNGYGLPKSLTYDTVNGWMGTVTGKNDQAAIETAKYLFGGKGTAPLNLSTITSDKSGAGGKNPQDTIFNSMTSPAMVDRIYNLASTPGNTDLWRNYVDWTSQTFRARAKVITDDIKDRTANNASVRNSLLPFYDAASGQLIVKERKDPSSNAAEAGGWGYDYSKGVVLDEYKALNKIIVNMKPILDKNGGNSVQQFHGFLKAMGIPIVGEDGTGSPTERDERTQGALDLTPKATKVSYAGPESGLPDSVDINRLPAGMRNNNPGNIKYTGGGFGVIGPSENTDQGDPQNVYRTATDGFAAAMRLAYRKNVTQGKSTVDALIAGNNGWTPGNHEAAANIARTMGISPDDPVDLSQPDQMKSFMRGLITQEHGTASRLYSDDLIDTALNYSGLYGGEEASNLKQTQYEATGFTESGGQVGFLKKMLGSEDTPLTMIANPRTSYPTPEDAKDFIAGMYPESDPTKFMSVIGSYKALYAPESKKPQFIFEPQVFEGSLDEAWQAASDKTRSAIIALSPEQKAKVGQAITAINRMPVAAVGFDPHRIIADAANTKEMSIAGAYSPDVDWIFADLHYGSAIAHESTHRGLELLRRAYPEETQKLMDRVGVKEETLVRWLMVSQAGDPESQYKGDAGLAQIQAAKNFFGEKTPFNEDNLKAVDEINALAQRYIKDKRPKGPR